MSKEEEIKGNKLIAEFMGYKCYGGNVVRISDQITTTIDAWAKYHSSWDWLIPVYNKILLLLNSDKELLSKLREDSLILHCVKTVLDASDVNLQININSSFLKITDFIQWYNNQPKPHQTIKHERLPEPTTVKKAQG